MDFTKATYQYNVILGMLDIALTCMIENDMCLYCLNNEDKDLSICNDVELCRSCLFEGLARKVMKKGN